ncbi:hypothetical protein [Mangrovibacterium sp.]|uniref:hypothetical protein n=1 Tax=Mangrovibacterium sp. TaxID=1961364 RepID=UPI0035637215
MIGKFFHTPKSRRFNITTRYYDPDKEKMENREERIKAELGLNEKKDWDPKRRANIRGQFRQSMGSGSKTAEDARKKSNTRLIFLVLILTLAVYLILKF